MKELIQGNQAIYLGAKKAGISFYAGYPITPASEIMHEFAKSDVKFIQAEDEIASINLCIGASLGGGKVMTATSGPGFSLMQESIGYAHMAEVPMVIVDVQRVGPSTGMPTIGAQQDVMQTRYGSHGDYFPIVFYPNSVEECFKLTIDAFNAAERTMSPVVILSDAYIAHLFETFDVESVEVDVINRERKPLGELSGQHFTGLLHESDGTLKTMDSDFYNKWIVEKKNNVDKVANDYDFYDYFENENSDTLLIGFGVVSRVLNSLKDKYAIFRPIRMFPVVEELKSIAEKYKKVVVVEMNSGQYKSVVSGVLGKEVEGVSIFGDVSKEVILNKL